MLKETRDGTEIELSLPGSVFRFWSDHNSYEVDIGDESCGWLFYASPGGSVHLINGVTREKLKILMVVHVQGRD